MGISNETEVAMNDISEAMLLKRRLDLAFKIKFDNVSREMTATKPAKKCVAYFRVFFLFISCFCCCSCSELASLDL